MDKKNLFFTWELINSKLWHIFEKSGGRSLCGKWATFYIPTKEDMLSEKATYKKGQDCKMCFKKAGLITNENN